MVAQTAIMQSVIISHIVVEWYIVCNFIAAMMKCIMQSQPKSQAASVVRSSWGYTGGLCSDIIITKSSAMWITQLPMTTLKPSIVEIKFTIK